jgi:hypothetical protein
VSLFFFIFILKPHRPRQLDTIISPAIVAEKLTWIRHKFGLGYAACPGINLAKIELSKVAASIVRDYDIRQVDPNQAWSYEAYFNTLPHSWPVYVTKVLQE